MPKPNAALGEPERLEVALHVQLGEADVDAVDVGDDVADEQQRQEPQDTPCGGRGRARVGEGASGMVGPRGVGTSGGGSHDGNPPVSPEQTGTPSAGILGRREYPPGARAHVGVAHVRDPPAGNTPQACPRHPGRKCPFPEILPAAPELIRSPGPAARRGHGAPLEMPPRPERVTHHVPTDSGRWGLRAAVAAQDARIAGDAPDGATPAGRPFRVPYRLTDTNHYLVRVRINGKGPFNFLVDSGTRPCTSAPRRPRRSAWSRPRTTTGPPSTGSTSRGARR